MSNDADLRELVKDLSPEDLELLVRDLSPAALSALGELKVGTSERDRQEFLRDPHAWVTQRMGEEMWSKQYDIFESVARNRRTAVKSAHGVGKSHLASRAVAWWLDIHEPGEAFVVTTAPTFTQVRTILWRYIRQAHKKGDLPGRVNQTEWSIEGEIVGYGRKPSDYDESGFQGIHALRVLVVIDEAGGVPRTLWTGADTLIVNEHCRILAIGNPDNPATRFKEICDPGSGWNTITISAFDSPNFTDEVVSEQLSQELVGPTWVADAKRDWGESSPLYLSKVLGEFPEDSTDGIIPVSAVAAARVGDATLDIDEDDVQLGVDVGAGGDRSVIYERRGRMAGRSWSSKHDDPEKLASEVIHAIRESGARRVCIDTIGWGWGTMGHVRSMCKADPELRDVEVVGVMVSQAAADPKRFHNLKAELWWKYGRELLTGEDADIDLSMIDDQTAADLTAPRYFLTTKGKIQVESKDDVRKRIGRSPDDADAFLLAFYPETRRAKVHSPRSWGDTVLGGAPTRAAL